MMLRLVYISPRRELKSSGARALVEDYLRRCGRFAPVELESFRSEAALREAWARKGARGMPHAVLLDSGGRALSSPQIAEYLRQQRDAGTHELTFAIGPPDGWSAAIRAEARLLLSLGAITLPHELALAVLTEQVYRALTILAGHPYHGGHE